MPPEALGALRCPKCGNDIAAGGEIRYVETIENHRRVRGVGQGQLQVDGLYQTGEGYDDGTNPQFECHGPARGPWCGHRWPVPEWILLLIDWV